MMHAHVLVFPFPAHGHMVPLLDFTSRIAAAGVTVTVVVTPKNLPLLNRLLSAHPTSITALVLRFPPHPAIPSGVENTADLPPGAFRFMLHSLGQLRDPLLRWFRSHPSPPAAIISDFFLGWTHHLACHLSIRRYTFSPSGALALAVTNSLWCQMPWRRNLDDDYEIVDFPRIPNSPSYPWWQLSPLYQSYVEGDPVLEFIKDSFRANTASHGLILNTYKDLEGVYLDYLSRELGHDRIWPIGPILPPIEVGPIPVILAWLDTCQDATVVYICFGSQAMLSKKQMEGLTLGLDTSGVKFILVANDKANNDCGKIPLGFTDRVRTRGVVIEGWAPQVAILKHRAVCAFLTHCGWNSTLEGIMAGVPLMTWPMGADQFANATLLENELGIGIRVCEGDEGVVDCDQMARVLAEAAAYGSSKWEERRARAMALRKAAQDATNIGGTSFNNLDTFINQLSLMGEKES